MFAKRSPPSQSEPEALESRAGPSFFDIFADVHTPPECLPAVRVGRVVMPHEQSARYMREAFRRAVDALDLARPAHSDRGS